jgi:hypothetical protein
MDRVFEKLRLEQIVRIKIEAIALDWTSVEVHPDGTGALNGPKIHLVPADARTAIALALSPGHAMMRRRDASCFANSERCRKICRY